MSDRGGQPAHSVKVGILAADILAEQGSEGAASRILSTMFEDVLGAKPAEVSSCDELREQILDGTSAHMRNLVQMRKKEVERILEEGEQRQRVPTPEAESTDDDLDPFQAEIDPSFNFISRLSDVDNSTGNESENGESEKYPTSSGSESGFW